MPFGRKSVDPSMAKVAVAEIKRTTSPTPKASQARNLSIGPPTSSVSPSISKATVAKKRTSDLGSEASLDTFEQIKRSKIEQKQLDAIAQPDGKKRCAECKATETSTWRRDLSGNLICNKCGLKKRKDHKVPSKRSAPQRIGERSTSVSTSNIIEERSSMVLGERPNSASGPLEAAITEDQIVVDPRPPRPWINELKRREEPAKVGPYIEGVTILPPAAASDHHSQDQHMPRRQNEGTERISPERRITVTQDVAKNTRQINLDRTNNNDTSTQTRSPATTHAPEKRSGKTGTGTQIIRMSMPALPGSTPKASESSTEEATKSITPSRRPGPKKAVNPRTLEPKVCIHCGTDESPAWRKDQDGNPMCNKCMLRVKRAASRSSGQGNFRKQWVSIEPQRAPEEHMRPQTPGIEQDRSLSQRTVDDTLDNRDAAQSAGRTESQNAFNNFTWLNTQSQPASQTVQMDHTEQQKTPSKVDAGLTSQGTNSKETPPAGTDSLSAPSMTSSASFYGSTGAEKSTTMVSRADTRAAARRQSHSPGLSNKSSDHKTAKPIKVAPGWVIIESNSPPRSRSTSPPWSSQGLDLLPEVRRKKRHSNVHNGTNTESTPPSATKKTTPRASASRERKASAPNSTGTKVNYRAPSGPSPLVLRTHTKKTHEADAPRPINNYKPEAVTEEMNFALDSGEDDQFIHQIGAERSEMIDKSPGIQKVNGVKNPTKEIDVSEQTTTAPIYGEDKSSTPLAGHNHTQTNKDNRPRSDYPNSISRIMSINGLLSRDDDRPSSREFVLSSSSPEASVRDE